MEKRWLKIVSANIEDSFSLQTHEVLVDPSFLPGDASGFVRDVFVL